MVGENIDEWKIYPFKLLNEEALTQQRNEMMDSFMQIFGGYQQATHLLRTKAPPP
jgi:hypothetical protein